LTMILAHPLDSEKVRVSGIVKGTHSSHWMHWMTAANEFYRRHYEGGVTVGATPLDVYARRYSPLANDIAL
jgi:hypothetical protein